MTTKDDENGFTLSPEEEAEILLSIAEAERGETISERPQSQLHDSHSRGHWFDPSTAHQFRQEEKR